MTPPSPSPPPHSSIPPTSYSHPPRHKAQGPRPKAAVLLIPTPAPTSIRIAASVSPSQSPPATALPSSRVQLLYAEAVDRQAHDPAPYHIGEERPNNADAVDKLARRASAANPTAVQLPASNAASPGRRSARRASAATPVCRPSPAPPVKGRLFQQAEGIAAPPLALVGGGGQRARLLVNRPEGNVVRRRSTASA